MQERAGWVNQLAPDVADCYADLEAWPAIAQAPLFPSSRERRGYYGSYSNDTPPSWYSNKVFIT